MQYVIIVSLVYCLVYLDFSSSCFGGHYYYDDDANETNGTEKVEKKRIRKKNQTNYLPELWGGFEVPSDLLDEWDQWLKEYKKQQRLEQNSMLQNSSHYYDERGPNSGWPLSWKGLGDGDVGSPPKQPPPYAYQPSNIGLPTYCYDTLLRGTCTKFTKRWAHHPYLDECVEFDYSGCGGNQNNFLTKLKCEEYCMTPPPSGCDKYTLGDAGEDIGINEHRRRAQPVVQLPSAQRTRKCGYF